MMSVIHRHGRIVRLSTAALLAGTIVLISPKSPTSAEQYQGKDKVELCHKPGTSAEQTKWVPSSAVKGHIRHGDFLGPCEEVVSEPGGDVDYVVDADGFATPGVGAEEAIDAIVGDRLEWFSDDCTTYLIGIMDNDGSGDFSLADDIVVESDTFGTDGRPWFFYYGEDRVILDLDGSLKDGQAIDAWMAVALAKFQFWYIDSNGDGCWEPTEDVILDFNGDGILDNYQSWGG